ncbi:hypothetical protein J2X69_005188, partial [Algoriphagus sp. 4150]|uniref:phosphopantetheine-binding protein n=1 Tax=Algoriphagus sp. 4150 TaxID=2817756 RepID=UPI002860F9FE
SSKLARIEGVEKTLTTIQDNQLVAYLVLNKTKVKSDSHLGEIPLSHCINQQIIRYLPSYMVPSHYIVMDELPLTLNGKIDYRQLPMVEMLQEEYVAPLTDVEKTLCAVWQQVLGLKRVSVTDNFFRIGGNSITAIQVSHQMSKILGYSINVSEIFKYSSINELVHRFEALSNNIDTVDWTV